MSKKIKKTGNEENILLLDGIFKAHMHPEIRKNRVCSVMLEYVERKMQTELTAGRLDSKHYLWWISL